MREVKEKGRGVGGMARRRGEGGRPD